MAVARWALAAAQGSFTAARDLDVVTAQLSDRVCFKVFVMDSSGKVGTSSWAEQLHCYQRAQSSAMVAAGQGSFTAARALTIIISSKLPDQAIALTMWWLSEAYGFLDNTQQWSNRWCHGSLNPLDLWFGHHLRTNNTISSSILAAAPGVLIL
jgi:hypothetical protein